MASKGGLWRGRYNSGKYLVLRRDGTIPQCAWFVFLEKDPAAFVALLAYANEAERLGYNEEFVEDVKRLAQIWARTTEPPGDPESKPHRKDYELVAEMMDGAWDNLDSAILSRYTPDALLTEREVERDG